ncbi:MAG: HD domain-containing phosphohydrolase [bacterium]
MSKFSDKNLKIGKPLPYDLILKRGGISFRKGTTITPEILKIIKSGTVLQISLDAPVTKKTRRKSKRVEPDTPGGKRLKKAFLVNRAKTAVNARTYVSDDSLKVFLDDISLCWKDQSRFIDISSFITIAEKWVDSINGNSSIPASIGWHQTSDNFIPAHMVDVARFVSCLGLHLGFDKESLVNLVLAGLLHDIGEMFIDSNLLSRRGKLNNSEIKRVREHPGKSVEWLKRAGLQNENVHKLILRHHERFDGSGYPYNITGKVLGMDDCLLAVADVYCALISRRPYRDALTRRDALRTIIKSKGKSFSQNMAGHLVSFLGLYPPGSIVELKSGTLALIITPPDKSSWDALLIDLESQGIPDEKIDLNNLDGDYIVREII